MQTLRLSIAALCTLAIITLVHTRLARAENAPREHDHGFFLRMSLGGGSAETKVEDSSGHLKFSGAAGDLDIAIGGLVSENLALHGTLWGWSIQDPDVELTLAGAGSGTGTANANLSLGAVGVGLTYYMMPANLYFSASVGLASLNIDSGNVSANSNTGGAFEAVIGKEWWVGNKWGLGLAGAFSYHSIPDPDVAPNWKGPGFALRFSATMN